MNLLFFLFQLGWDHADSEMLCPIKDGVRNGSTQKIFFGQGKPFITFFFFREYFASDHGRQVRT